MLYALEHPLSVAEQVRAYELLGYVAAAVDDSAAAVLAFRRALETDSAYEPKMSLSPKVRGYFEEARRQVDRPVSPLPAVAVAPEVFQLPAAALQAPEPAPQATSANPSLFSRWWFWAGVGVVVAGAGVATWELTRPRLTAGNLGTGDLR